MPDRHSGELEPDDPANSGGGKTRILISSPNVVGHPAPCSSLGNRGGQIVVGLVAALSLQVGKSFGVKWVYPKLCLVTK